jgi:hypothetical protein
MVGASWPGKVSTLNTLLGSGGLAYLDAVILMHLFSVSELHVLRMYVHSLTNLIRSRSGPNCLSRGVTGEGQQVSQMAE